MADDRGNGAGQPVETTCLGRIESQVEANRVALFERTQCRVTGEFRPGVIDTIHAIDDKIEAVTTSLMRIGRWILAAAVTGTASVAAQLALDWFRSRPHGHG